MNILKLIHNSILCIKYPWLYPCCYNGLHYYDATVLDKIQRYKKHSNSSFDLFNIRAKLLTFYHNYILALFHCVTRYTILDFIPKGWKNRFANEIIDKVSMLLKKSNSNLSIIDIKEKYGRLRVSIICEDKNIQDYFETLEERSSFVCINCGKDAKYVTTGWVLPYCEKCLPSNKHYISIKGQNEK